VENQAVKHEKQKLLKAFLYSPFFLFALFVTVHVADKTEAFSAPKTGRDAETV
jgi:hypothetical protein